METEYQIAKANENIEPGFSELMDWLDNVAEEMNPQEILTMFVRAVQIDKTEVRLYFAFDYYGDNFTPPKKDEHPVDGCSSNSPMVEARRIELRSYMAPWQASPSSVVEKVSRGACATTHGPRSSWFDLSLRHTNYVRKCSFLR